MHAQEVVESLASTFAFDFVCQGDIIQEPCERMMMFPLDQCRLATALIDGANIETYWTVRYGDGN